MVTGNVIILMVIYNIKAILLMIIVMDIGNIMKCLNLIL